MSGSDGGAPPEPPELVAWRDLCRRLETAGEQLLADPYPPAPEDRAEGFAHLAGQLLCWLGWANGHGDPRRPFFMRQNDLVTPWGGPNADNVYRHARIDPGRRYRLVGRLHSAEDFILALRAGFMHQERWGTLAEHTASDLGIESGGEVELLLVPAGTGTGGTDGTVPVLEIPEGAVMVSIREYYVDWRAGEPAHLVIEGLDDPEPLPRLTGGEVAARFAEAAAGVEHSMGYWVRYMRDERAAATDNAFAPSFQLAKGLAAARYAFCYYDLGPDDALLVEGDVPDARYWSLQLYTPAWFELVEPVERIASRNHTQLHVDADGRFRAVVSHRDPGVANWLDAGDRPVGLCTLRWFWPRGETAPEVSARVLPTADVAAHLPAGTATVDPAARTAEVAARRRHLAHRFRA